MKQVNDLLYSYETYANNLSRLNDPIEFFNGLSEIAGIITQISKIKPGLAGKSQIKRGINKCHEIKDYVIKEFLNRYCEIAISALPQCMMICEAKKHFDNYISLWKYKAMLSHDNKTVYYTCFDELTERYIVWCYNLVASELPKCNTIDDVWKKLDEFYSVNKYRGMLSKKNKALFSNCFDKLQSHKATAEKSIREREASERTKTQKEFKTQVNADQALPLCDNDKRTTMLHPQSLKEYIGQDKSKDRLKILIEAARKSGEPLGHILLCSPTGTGKTTLANVIANEMDASIRKVHGTLIKEPKDLAALLTSLQVNDVLFIDEIDQLHFSVMDVLYTAMENSMIDIIIGQGTAATNIPLELKHFTLIGATTKLEQVKSPLRDYFSSIIELEPYSVDELTAIRILQMSETIGITIDCSGALEIAKDSRDTSDSAIKKTLMQIRDFAQVKSNRMITRDIAVDAMRYSDLSKEAIVANGDSEKHFDLMNGTEFEQFCADLLTRRGYTKVKTTSSSGDYGVDILAEKDNVTYAIQCKRYDSNIGNTAIQEVFSGKEFYKCHVGVVMTNQYFTPSAIKTAKRTGIILWDRDYLEEIIETANV